MSKPWLSRPDWADRVVRHEDVARWKAFLVGGVIAALGVAPIWGALERPHEFDNTAARVFAGLFGGLIAAGGLWIIGSQLFDLLIRRGRDAGTCRLRTLPGAVGGWFAAEVTIPDVGFSGALKITLTSMRRTRIGEEVRVDVYWSDQVEAEPRSLPLAPDGGRVANARFRIPEGVPITTLDDDDNRVLWQLAVSGPVRGSDLALTFEVPVFEAKDANAAEQQAAETEAWLPAPASSSGQPDGVTLRGTASGVELWFAPRERGGALIALAAGVVFGVAGVAIREETPWWFSGFFFVAAVVCVYGALDGLLRHWSVAVDRSGVTTGAYGWGSSKRFDAEKVRDVTITFVDPHLRVTSPGETHVVILVDDRGRRVKLSPSFERKADAEWVRTRILEQLGR